LASQIKKLRVKKSLALTVKEFRFRVRFSFRVIVGCDVFRMRVF
jgi:hypothetical protein